MITAEELSKMQKEISVSEFFEKNKHLLGFDNKTKALLMVVKEAVDNSLDACEEAGILPNIKVSVSQDKERKDVYKVVVEDNGPGVLEDQVGKVFGKLLYGSKFYRLRQSRGQQGIGISAAVLYAQLTVGEPVTIYTKTANQKLTKKFKLYIDTSKNEPDIIDIKEVGNKIKDHGLIIELKLIGRYKKSKGIIDYLRQTSISNPYAKIIYHDPDGKSITFPRSVDHLPKPPKEMKPHPYGIEFGILIKMLKYTKAKSLQSFLTNDFSSVGSVSAKEICKISKLDKSKKPNELERKEIERLLNAMQNVRLQRPSTDCLSPIGEKELEKSLRKKFQDAEFFVTVTRAPTVYRGNPFQIEVGIAYGGNLPKDKQIKIIRFANRVPLIYQQTAGAISEAIIGTSWKRYGIQQSSGSIPIGPMVLVVHMCSVWVPFISEGKEAIAPYPDIVKEIKLAIQDAARKLSRYLSGKRKVGEIKRKIKIFEKYAIESSDAISKLTGVDKRKIEKLFEQLINKKMKSGDNNE